MTPLKAPPYRPVREPRVRLALAVEHMRKHMTDEGWQLMQALEHAGYNLCGANLNHTNTNRSYYQGVNVSGMLNSHLGVPGVVVVQDKREWLGLTADRSMDSRAKFRHVGILRERPDIFKLTVLKDAHQDPLFHEESAEEIDCHAWIVYYHPDTVCRLAPYVRRRHLIRTYHTVDADRVPEFNGDPHARDGCILSGALGQAYPLRQRLVDGLRHLPGTTYVPHPGYHARGCETPEYMRMLSHFRVSICTSSVYGYALRKIIESTACGCVVLTDLPEADRLPGIDGNLFRIDRYEGLGTIANVIRQLHDDYDFELQEHYAQIAREYYDYRPTGLRLAADIESLRVSYDQGSVDQHAQPVRRATD